MTETGKREQVRERQSQLLPDKPPASDEQRIAVIYLTPPGGAVARRLEAAWPQVAGGTAPSVITAVPPLRQMAADLWHRFDGLIFIMAAGIVVRTIAPLLESKWRDPGVVVIDERGSFAVSLVGGHWGEANTLARKAAACLGAVPVVTTATDVQGRPAIDLLAKQWGFRPDPRSRVKGVNSALLAGERVAIYTEWDLSEEIPSSDGGAASDAAQISSCSLQEFTTNVLDNPEAVPVLVTSRMVSELPTRGLYLRPPSLAAGIGCRRGVTAAEIADALEQALRLAGRSRDSLALLASHAVKADEAGLLEAAGQLGLELKVFSSDILNDVFKDHPNLQRSQFVQKQLGVGGVCETAALAAVPEGALVLMKGKFGRVTVALAEAGWLWSASGRAIRRT